MLKKRDVIIACDFADKPALEQFLRQFQDEKLFCKIGMELYYSEGPDIVRLIKSLGHNIFLDLKLHDIPNTVGKAMKRLGALGVDMTNLHAAGGSEMMKAALEGLREGSAGDVPLLIAVTQLTSTGAEMLKNELLIDTPLNDTVVSYAKNACSCGLDGVVCSPLETQIVKAACGENFLTVTPGIRYPDSESDDQTRVTTPEKARLLGSDYIVVGRPITASNDPVAAYRRVLNDFLQEDM